MILPVWMIQFMKYRFPVSLAMFLGGIALIFAIGGEWAWLIWLPGLILLLAHIFVGTAATASQLLQMNDLEGAKAMLAKTLNVNWLYTPFRTNYHAVDSMIAMMGNDAAGAEAAMKRAAALGGNSDSEQAVMLFNLGMMQMQQQNVAEAEKNMRRATELGLPDEQASIAELNFAFIALNKRNINVAKKHAEKCRALKPTNADVLKHLAEFDKAMKQSGQYTDSTMAMRMAQQRNQKKR